MPGVSVVLVNQSRGTEQTAVSDDTGNFLFPIVQPGTYVLKLSLTGFQSLEKTGIVVNANDRLMAGNFTLTLGQLSESVVVTGVSSDIQLKSGERAYTLQSSTIQNVAVNGRSFFGLAVMVPGVLPQDANVPGQVSNFNVNGQRSNSNNMTIDGVANIDTGDNGGNMAQTNLDADRRVQGADVELPGRVRPGGRRAGAGRDQERLEPVLGFRLLVRAAIRLERQHVAQ